MKKTFLILFAIFFLATPFLSFGQETSNNDTEKKCNISYTFINEYGFFLGGDFGFTGIFVNGIRFNKTNDVLGIGVGYEVDSRSGQSIPIFVNFRHYFPAKKILKPLINVGIGTRISFWERYDYYEYSSYYPKPKQMQTAGLYGTIAAGFKVRAFSFTSGFFLKSWNREYFGGVEVKVGFTF
jgi:hypothetical protein